MKWSGLFRKLKKNLPKVHEQFTFIFNVFLLNKEPLKILNKATDVKINEVLKQFIFL